MAHSPEVIQELTDKTKVIRRNVLRIFESSRMGHCGGTMSLVEIVTALYFHHLKLDPKNCDWPERDRVVLSKAHAAEAIYAVLPEIGYVPKENLDKYYCYGSPFQGHADRWCTPGIDYSGGSLGQGLSFASWHGDGRKNQDGHKSPGPSCVGGKYAAVHHEFQPSLSYLLYCWRW